MRQELSTDVLVMGAGPAGCAAAMTLVAHGVDVVLVDRSNFPRDKVCGDALIPDALAALRVLGLEADVCRLARTTDAVRVYAPRGAYMSVPGRSICLPRHVLDALLLRTAIQRGATFLAPYAARPLGTGTVRGATLRHASSRDDITIFAKTTILATGAGLDGISAFDVAERPAPSAVAGRAYFKVPHALAETVRHLTVSYDASIAPGYGWIFPGPDDIFNVGVGCFLDLKKPRSKPTLTDLWATFTDRFQPARDLLKHAEQVGPLRGAPLRTGMRGSRLCRPGMLVVGEAASLTYSFSGEGLGKAMSSGIVAGTLIADAFRGRLSFDALGAAYSARLEREFAPRFREYQTAQRWLEHPKVVDLLVWRGRRGTFVRRQLEGVFNETAAPRNLMSMGGIVRSLLQ